MSPSQLSELLSAYLDGEAKGRERRLAERLLAQDATARRLYADLRHGRELVNALPRHPAPASIFSDLQARIERSALLDDPHGTTDVTAFRAFRRLLPVAAAASLVFVAFAGWWYLEHDVRPAADPLASSRSQRPNEGADSATGWEPVARAISLTVEEKLAGGASAWDIQSHPFAVEPVQLQVVAKDAPERRALADKLTRQLASADLVDAGRSVSGDRAAAVDGAGAFFLRGRRGTNFSSGREDAILVRASADQIAQVFREMPSTAGDGAQVQLRAGALTVKGPVKSQEILQVLSGPSYEAEVVGQAGFINESRDAAERGGDETRTVRTDADTADREFLDDFLESVGVSPELLARKPAPTPTDSEAGPSVPGALVARREGALAAKEEKSDNAWLEGPSKSGLARTTTSSERNDAEPPAARAKARRPGGVSDETTLPRYVTFVIQIVDDDRMDADIPTPGLQESARTRQPEGKPPKREPTK